MGLVTEVTNMKVGDIMTRNVVSCQLDADIGVAARLMLEGRFGTLPVVDARGTIAGVITDRDIAMAAATRQRNASHIGVHEAISADIFSCGVDDEVGSALKRMETARVRRLPVLDGAGRLCGILSIDDIVLRALDRADGVSSVDFIKALRAICSQPPVEPEVNYSETFVSG